MKVLKFGGSSVGKPRNIPPIIKLIQKQIKSDADITVVYSAFSGVTDTLIKIGHLAQNKDVSYKQHLESVEAKHEDYLQFLFTPEQQSDIRQYVEDLMHELEEIAHGVYLLKELSQRSLDLISSFGERFSTYIISEYARTLGMDIQYLDSRQLIVTNDNFGAAKVDFKMTQQRVKEYYRKNPGIKFMTGFIAATVEGVTTTLGRGGSDFTASIMGAALDADEIQIWTDVDGVMTANPSSVPAAFSLKGLSYEEAMELSHFGAKVLHSPTIQPALEKQIPIRILNTFHPEFEGTLIKSKANHFHHPIKGITSISDVSLLTLQGSGMVGVSGISSRLFSCLAKENISVILISQASSEHSICFVVTADVAKKAKRRIEAEFELEIKAHLVDEVKVEDDVTIIAVVGENMRKTPGISGRLFKSLGDNGVNVVAIAQGSSELNISTVVSRKDQVKALNVIHSAFFHGPTITAHLILAGTGLIGSELLNQIYSARERILNDEHVDLKIVGLADVDHMVFEKDGIENADWQAVLQNSSLKSDPQSLVEHIEHLRLPNCVFIDCTASPEIPEIYADLFERGVSVVTANKIANSGSMKTYGLLRQLRERHRVGFRYETNVGAGLPVINTLKDLLVTGDTITKIEAVLSGTFSYIFNTFDGSCPFSDVVREAREKGFTEPDPRIDLSGLDVARKILILVRELGHAIELEEIPIQPILPAEVFEAENVEAFFDKLKKYDENFAATLQIARQNNRVLRYIAEYENGQARVALKQIAVKHPFYKLSNSDNIIAISSARYRETPLVIKGPGAGAGVTAAGVFADILHIVKSEK